MAAVEVESVLNRHPAVRQAAVAATPDKVRGDEVAAVIIAEQGGADRKLAEEIVRWSLAQMAYYVASGLARYGGDDGLTVYKRSDFGGLINLGNRVQFYYLCLFCLLAVVVLIWRIVNSRFGLVLQGLRSNEQRMQAIGFPSKRYKLACFVIAGMLCGLSGALLANNTDFVSPAVMYWTRSGDLMVMVILGGMGTLMGPVVGSVVFLVLEEVLSQLTEYWALIMGPLLLLIVLFGRGGIMGMLGRLNRG
ncbi:MAG: branched-chain amino acid ABC transporter permease [Bradyrhizobium sp.]|nr:branched-chain amino acid ABC transporter permease [Bradyrhizobium sp.]